MKIDWSAISHELSLLRRDGIGLPLWWRDDDAVADTPALARLADISDAVELPVYVAAIPDLIEPTLVASMTQYTNLIPVIHGWRHISHAPKGEKNAEFGHARESGKDELAQGYYQMQAAFGTALVPLFVPPWNRIAPFFIDALSASGYRGLSTFGPRKNPLAAQGVVQINTHVDPIFWRGDRGLVDPEHLVTDLTRNLQARRTGQADASEPLGLLTHHLVHTPQVWSFSQDLITVLMDGGAQAADIKALL